MAESPDARSGRMRTARTVLRAGFLLLGLAGAAFVWIGAFQMAHTVSEAVPVAHRADRSTYLVGEVAHRVDDIAATLDEEPGEQTDPATRDRVYRDLQRLNDAMRALPSFLDEEDASTFTDVKPKIDAFRRAVLQVLDESAAQYTERSRDIFQHRLLPIVASLEGPLDHLIDLNARQSERLLGELDRHLSALRRSQIVLGGLFMIFLAGVAFGTLRLIQRQHLALARRFQEIEQINCDLDAFAGRVAHDLKGPLTPILLLAGRLRIGMESREAVADAALRISTSAERANRLIASLLAFSRAVSDRTTALDGPCFTADVVQRAVKAAADAAAQAHIDVSSNVANVAVSIDASLLEQVLDNLLTNAIRYMGARTPRKVSVSVRERDGIARFEVADTGPGVPADARRRIFEPFFRVDPTLRGGVGLGLATTKRIVESRGGEIGVCDAPGGGALFWFTLPVRDLQYADVRRPR